ncbi:undecaprenyl-diphosphate phosphatase [Moraxella nasicaprae]|uniref:Undecaprenyl-diphosphatase n=1 Tax=Moraxella nasicaprae TaxID=2904122 RepID=A0ABY6F5C0_9GAMM|nr:undecaprenyl-diphosphate phosphatase [Moraxella nasicaprae]UXZ05090.1 undecaprenyl-diphosphate phosphatase [Moraxella nasicaprae]
MDILLFIKAFIMGVVEGITEFLPISSTGYLILSADLMNFWTKEKAALFIVVIQMGAMLAVVYDYWGRLWNALMGLLTGKAQGLEKPRQLGLSLIIATLPVMVIGLLFEDFITEKLFHPVVVAIMLIVGAVLIIYAEKTKRPIIAQTAEQIDFKTAIKIGLAQCLALIPGTSRSGATIIGALLFGTSRTAGTEFSFFLGIPVIMGAALLGLIKHKEAMQTANDWAILGVGFMTSFIIALICIRFMVAWVSKKDFMIFAYLRIVTGIIVLIAFFGFGYAIEG